jgi:hypothetical protein
MSETVGRNFCYIVLLEVTIISGPISRRQFGAANKVFQKWVGQWPILYGRLSPGQINKKMTFCHATQVNTGLNPKFHGPIWGVVLSQKSEHFKFANYFGMSC